MKLTKKEINKKGKPNPIFDGLPDGLKDPKNFKGIEDKLNKCLISDHKHATIKSYVKCKRCQDKLRKKQALMKELGFKDFTQYAEWRKIMSIIINKKDIQLR